ncbi:MAG: hypothetical protein IKQ05_00490 [Prevotella sp.]|jgi:hypothetical protein|nr:hypothetical protein [Prevotella sp.]
MKFHIFNPEHDIALASNLANFTAPHAGRQLRHDLGFLPAVWAQEGDGILTDDVEHAQRCLKRLMAKVPQESAAHLRTFADSFLTAKKAAALFSMAAVDPWGWDRALKASLLRCGLDAQMLPADTQLDLIRRLSHRMLASRLLPMLRVEGTVGESQSCTETEELESLLKRHGRLVLKAPWSSSGRGLRFLDISHTPVSAQEGWIRNVIASQGGVMAEPYYNKVKDFGMEFHTDGAGHTTYLGLSLFHTMNGAYTGNILATELKKQAYIARYLPVCLTDYIRDTICQQTAAMFQGRYEGPFGVDMMIVARSDDDGFLLHPCVEINLRRTMGHAALAMTKLYNPSNDEDLTGVMRIRYEDNNYKLILQRL